MGVYKFDAKQRYAIGKEYSERKQRHYNHLTATSGNIAMEMGRENGIGEATVKRFHAFYRAVNAIRRYSHEAADRLMEGKARMSAAEIARMLKDNSYVDAVDRIIGRKADPKQDTSQMDMILKIKGSMRDHSRIAYTAEMLIGDIRADAENYIHNLRSTLEERSGVLTDGTKPQVAAEIARIADEILKVREAL